MFLIACKGQTSQKIEAAGLRSSKNICPEGKSQTLEKRTLAATLLKVISCTDNIKGSTFKGMQKKWHGSVLPSNTHCSKWLRLFFYHSQKGHHIIVKRWQAVTWTKPLSSFLLLIHIMIGVNQSEYGTSSLIFNLKSKGKLFFSN